MVDYDITGTIPVVVSGSYTGNDEPQQIITVSKMKNAKCAIISQVNPSIGSNYCTIMYSSASGGEGQFINDGFGGTAQILWIDQNGGVGGGGFTVRPENGFNSSGAVYKYVCWGSG